MNIGKNIKQMRENLGMEQQELAEKLNISNKTISSWECGRTEPKMGMIEAMCKVFNCSKTALIDGETEPTPKTTHIEIEKREFHTRSMSFPPEIMEYAVRLMNLKPEVREKLIQMIELLEEKRGDQT